MTSGEMNFRWELAILIGTILFVSGEVLWLLHHYGVI